MTRHTLALALGTALAIGAGCGPSARSDALIEQDVSAELSSDEALRGDTISVRSVDGHVTLTGTVSDPDDRAEAERIAGDVSGVKEVDNALEVAAGPSAAPGLPPVGSPPPPEPAPGEATPPPAPELP
jgi:Flp pilus assembly secretin CpaC